MVSCLFTFLKQATKTLSMLKLLKNSAISFLYNGQPIAPKEWQNHSSQHSSLNYNPSNFKFEVTVSPAAQQEDALTYDSSESNLWLCLG